MGLVKLVAVAAVGVVVGTVLGDLPPARDAWTFWAGNLGAPYLVLPGLVGMLRWRSSRAAAFAGAAFGAALVAGFYDLPALLLRSSADGWAVLDTLAAWTSAYGLGGPGDEPWLLIAAVLGGLMGAVGHAARRGSVVAGVAVVAAALVEPAFHVAMSLEVQGLDWYPLVGGVGYPLSRHNLALWAVEGAVGVVLLALVLVNRPPSRRGSGVRGVSLAR